MGRTIQQKLEEKYLNYQMQSNVGFIICKKFKTKWRYEIS
jgi:hypothetical protein